MKQEKQDKQEQNIRLNSKKNLYMGQIYSQELPKTLEITEMTENFTKVTKHLTTIFKETLINYVWEKYQVRKQ